MAKKSTRSNARSARSRTSSRTKKNSSFWQWGNRRSMVILFVVVFAALGVYLLIRSQASTGTALGATDLDTTASVNATKITETGANSKRNYPVVQLTSSASSKAILHSATKKLGAGIYKACLNGLAKSASVTGTLTVQPYQSTVPSGSPVSKAFTLAVTQDYTSTNCVANLYLYGTAGVQASVTNTGSGTLRIGSVIFARTGDLPAPPPPSTSNCSGVAKPAGSSFSTLAFCDDFSGTSLNQKIWAPFWFYDNNTQNGTLMKAANVSVSGGFLNLLINSNGQGSIVSSNPTASSGVAGYTGYQLANGYVEAKVCLPAASDGSIANWPAWWTDGQHWPNDGELDVLEGLSGNAKANWHDTSGGHTFGSGGHMTGCHIFAANWKPGEVKSYYDDVNLGSYRSSLIGSSPQYLILENSNGQYGGTKVNNVTMKVDWVRVWR